MTMTPAIKGQITKAIKTTVAVDDNGVHYNRGGAPAVVAVIRPIFAKHMPREQAKHAARKYLAAV
jgi:hypothetical protein